ncbi:hypothetical protein V6K52_07975 [Knoellia sp. S7-12]|uniref:hypothetical protein n=1 Tax=Knoellia sp. S7-12 TaxID=3126698 RepID=UPI00336661E3
MIVQRNEATDTLTRHGRTALLLDNGTVVLLNELSAAIYALSREPIDVYALVSPLEEEFGAPEGRSTINATQDAVAELIHHGILRPTAG